MTLPITLPQRQAYASNRGRQTYGSKPISFRAALRALRTSLSRKQPGLANKLEIADYALFVQRELLAIVEAETVSTGTQNFLKQAKLKMKCGMGVENPQI
ncbi:hypothetical protein [Calothrix sp. 336/3]|uniref:hypothetical protein n=1 Tax=Calothrix sp. 336/3 TaxID=1337936 RepID=UPI0004E36B1D|nr:hypothetical protein [Calothrix sp. 336/3]AKG20149.1 hypothetical protein IJ00_01460 [Calothrix sp. 336/3]